MSEPSLLRAMGVPVPGEISLDRGALHVAMTVKPAASLPITVWAIDRCVGIGEIGVAQLDGDDAFAAMTGTAPIPSPSAQRLVAPLSLTASRHLRDDLERADLLRLGHVPLTGNDGLTMSVLAHWPAWGTRSFSAWEPRGAHRTVMIRLVEIAYARFAATPWAAVPLMRAREPA